jgi:flavin-dependent dehydrogenase
MNKPLTNMHVAHTVTPPDYDVIIIGGGLAGLVSAVVLARAHKRVLLLEKKTYPFHKVCGEYVSNEVLPYMQQIGFDPFEYGAVPIRKLRISSPSGRNIYAPLDMGAFSLSRYTMDYQLAHLAMRHGTEVRTGVRATDVHFHGHTFSVETLAGETFSSKFVIGSWGKRETMDKKLNRPFIHQRTRYMAVKYHIHTDYPADEIGLDNYDGGYCGISRIEDGKYNLCNFYRRPAVHPSVDDFKERVVYKNPVLKSLFLNSEFLFETPVVINEISFAPKAPVEHHILMCGDSAGLITPLCGNGMSMAVTAAKMLTDLLLASKLLDAVEVPLIERSHLETAYAKAWKNRFKTRLFWGRTIQGFFGNAILTEASLRLIHAIPPLERRLIKATHGRVI